MRKTNVRQHTRTVKGRPVNVIRHERRVQEQLGRLGATSMSQASKVVKEIRERKAAKREPLLDEFVKATVSMPTTLFREGDKAFSPKMIHGVRELKLKERFMDGNTAYWNAETAPARGIAVPVTIKEEDLRRIINNPNTNPQAAPFMKKELTELDVHLLTRRLNDGKVTEKEALAIMPKGGWDLEADQVEKGRNWLNKIWKNKAGIVKADSPFDYRQEAALQSFRTAKMVGVYSEDGKWFMPVYRVIGTEGQFDYSVKGGEIRFY